MQNKVLTGTALAIMMTVSLPVMAQTLHELDEQTSQLYQENKDACMQEYGPSCHWYGCYGGVAKSPSAITQKAIRDSLTIISSIVESNIEPWWAAWWGWTPPDNNSEYQKLGELYAMFSSCNLEIDNWEFFPTMEDIPSYSMLTDNAKNRINETLENIRIGQ